MQKASSKLLEIEGISKTFPGIKALDSVSFSLDRGESIGLVGENGAGKSTLIKILAGIYSHDEGSITIDGEKIAMKNPWEADDAGLNFIHQHLNMVPFFDAVDNAFLGQWKKKGFNVDKREMMKRIDEICDEFNFDIDLKKPVQSMTTAEKWMIQIIRAFIKRPKILVMDEPTAALSDREVTSLFKVVEKIKSQGVSIIYVSHRMNEIFSLTDKVIVLRNGKKVFESETKAIDLDTLVKNMVGREREHKPMRKNIPGEVKALEIHNLNFKNKFRNLNFSINQGEILGVYGLQGAGRTEMAETIFGLNRGYSGSIKLYGEEIHPKNTQEAIEKGIALVPEDRMKEGLVLSHSILDNLALPNLADFTGRFGFFRQKQFKNDADHFIKKLNVSCRGYEDAVETLSGGNQQKIVLTKWLMKDIKLFIFDEPTVGVDVGARGQVYELIHDIASQGVAVMVISSDIDEIIEMGPNRVMVMKEGEISGMLSGEDMEQQKILKLCYRSE